MAGEDTMQRFLLRSLSVALAGLLGACGAERGTSAGEGLQPAPPDDIAAPEYGAPPGPDPGAQPAAAPGGATLHGKVIQAGTDKGLEGIQVTFCSERTFTDADGLFTITLERPLEPGERHALTAADMDGAEHGGDHHSGSVRVAADDEGALPDIPDDLWMIKLRKR